MKTKLFLFAILISVLLTSCTTTSYFQVYKAVPSDKMVLENDLLVYEDENCKVSYHLWSEGGDIGFQFFNKTDKNIYINLDNSFFVLNGISYNYFKNRVFTNSSSSGLAISKGAIASTSMTGANYFNLIQTNRVTGTHTSEIVSSSGYSVSYNEERIVCVPSQTSKIISEYSITHTLFRDCDLLRYPTKKQLKTRDFTKTNSPLVFSNRIAYAVGYTDNLIRFENDFYVKEISNYPEKELIEFKEEEFCGQKSQTMIKYFMDVSADKFYLTYDKNLWKH